MFQRVAAAVGIVALVALGIANIKLRAEIIVDGSCNKNCGCGTSSCEVYRSCNGGQDLCVTCTCSQHVECAYGPTNIVDACWTDDIPLCPGCQ